MTRKKDPVELKPRGRKKVIPSDARNRTIRCTDAEYTALMAHLWQLRGESPDREQPAIPSESE